MDKLFFNKKGRFFIVIFLANAFTTIVSIFLLSVLLLINLESIGLKMTGNHMKNMLKQITYTANYLNQYANTMGMQTLIDTDVKLLINHTNPDYQQVSKGIRRLHTYRVVSPFIDSIYVYNGINNRFFSTKYSGLTYEGGFFDTGVMELIDASFQDTRHNLFTRVVYDPFSKQNLYFYSLVQRNDNYNRKDIIPSAIVININELWLRNMIDDINSDTSNSILIINKYGYVVSHHDSSSMFMKDISNTDYIKTVMVSTDNSGSFITSIDNIKYFITYSSSSILDWKFISMIPYSNVIKDIQKMRLTSFYICIVMLLLSFVTAYIASLKVYTPLNSVISNIRKLVPLKNHCNINKSDEIQFLSTEFSWMASQVALMHTKQKEITRLMRNDLLKKILITDPRMEFSEVLTKLEELDLSIDIHLPARMVILKIDSYPEINSNIGDSACSLIRFSMGNISSEVFKDNGYPNEVIDLNYDSIAFILNEIPYQGNEANLLLKNHIKSIQEASLKYLDVSVSAFISNAIPNLSGFSLSYMEAMGIMAYRLKYGNQCILTPEMLESIQTGDIRYPVDKEKVLIDALNLGHLEDAKANYYSIINQCVDSSCNTINLWINRLIYSLYSTYTPLENNDGETAINFSAFIQDLSNLDTLEAISSAITQLLERICNMLQQKKAGRHNNLIEEIKKEIHMSFHDPNLSVSSLADQFNMSSIYLSKLFKEHTMEPISEYISNVRLDKSKKYLNNSRITINQISDKVGFNNTKYFSTFFKKKTGMTPGEFRRNC